MSFVNELFYAIEGLIITLVEILVSIIKIIVNFVVWYISGCLGLFGEALDALVNLGISPNIIYGTIGLILLIMIGCFIYILISMVQVMIE